MRGGFDRGKKPKPIKCHVCFLARKQYSVVFDHYTIVRLA